MSFVRYAISIVAQNCGHTSLKNCIATENLADMYGIYAVSINVKKTLSDNIVL